MTERRLGEAEVRRVLGRAAGAEARSLPARHDPTVTELMAVAAEVGLDPEEVRRAAAIRPAPTAGGVAALLGAPARRVVRAVSATGLPDRRTGLAAAVEAAAGKVGTVSTDAPGRWTWRESHGIGRTTASVAEVSPGEVEVTVTTDRSGHYLGYWLVGLLGWAAASALLPITLSPVAAVAAFLVTPPILARPFWRAADRRVRDSAEEAAMALLRALDAEASMAGSEPLLPPGEPGESP